MKRIYEDKNWIVFEMNTKTGQRFRFAIGLSADQIVVSSEDLAEYHGFKGDLDGFLASDISEQYHGIMTRFD